MTKFNVKVVHQLQRQDAVIKLKGFSDELKSQVQNQVTDVEEKWDDDGNLDFSFKALGFKVSGRMVTCESQVTVVGDLPFAASPLPRRN